MAETYDVIVVGLGGMGSAAAYQLAGRGARVLGLERYAPAHDRGSSHGGSRIIRQSYFEGPEYVPLLLRAYELWERLEAESGEELMTLTGGLMIGAPVSEVVSGSVRSAREHGLPHELLDATEIGQRFPPLRPAPHEVALYEERAGFVRPEASVRAHLSRAAALGAELRFEEPMFDWGVTPRGGVSVSTATGAYEAERLVLALGAWAPQLLGDLGLPLEIERQVQYWFAPAGGAAPFGRDRFPIYIWQVEDGVSFYGFPAQPSEDGVKVAFFRMGSPTTPEGLDREVHPEEIARMRAYVADRVPELAAGAFVRAVPCLYTTTPDQHFVLGPHPRLPQVVVASPCSGHGYKFASVVGEILAELAIQGESRLPIGLFAPDRFAGVAAG